MEIVLLWLDDLDDLIFAAAVSWSGTCRLGLAAGFPAALVLVATQGTDVYARWGVGLGLIAAASVIAWLCAAVPLVTRPLRGSLAAA